MAQATPPGQRAQPQLNCFTCQNRNKDEWCALSLEDMTLLDKAKITYTFEPGQTIYAQGDACRGIYDIESGTVAVRRTDADGNSILVRLAHAGQTLGYRDYFGGKEYTSSAEALRGTRVCHIASAAMRELLDHNPALGLRFLERIAADLDTAEESLLQRSTLPIRTRLAHLLLTLKFRYGVALEDGTIQIRLPMQRQDMAALLGTRPETLARAFQAMRNDGVLVSSGRTVTIPDLDGLLDEIEPIGN
jgi:CRP/FNR family transcriptional regulator